MSAIAVASIVDVPDAAPRAAGAATLADTGLTADQVEQLLVKTLYTGEATGLASPTACACRTRCSSRSSSALRAEQLIEVRGATGSGTAGYRYALTDPGRDRARQYLDANQYVGPAPVPLASLRRRDARAARRRAAIIDRERLRSGFSHLIIGDQMLEQLGPAVNAGKAHVPLRPARKRQDRDRRRHGPHARRRHVHAARDRRRRPHRSRCSIRSTTSRSRPRPTSSSIIAVAPRDRRWVRIRRPVVDGRRRADARHARPDLQSDRRSSTKRRFS